MRHHYLKVRSIYRSNKPGNWGSNWVGHSIRTASSVRVCESSNFYYLVSLVNCILKDVIWISNRLGSAYRQPWLRRLNGSSTGLEEALRMLKSHCEGFGEGVDSIWTCNCNSGFSRMPAFGLVNGNRLSRHFHKPWVSIVASNQVSCVWAQTVKVLDFKLDSLHVCGHVEIVNFLTFLISFVWTFWGLLVFKFDEWQHTVDF